MRAASAAATSDSGSVTVKEPRLKRGSFCLGANIGAASGGGGGEPAPLRALASRW